MSIQKLNFYNTITKKKEPFTSSSPNVNWYICGPTVYDSPHIGHARTYISFDVIRSVMELHFGYKVNYVMNITDVDDKIIQRAKEDGVDCGVITQKYEKEFFESMAVLGVRPPTFVTRVTEFIKEIEDFIEDLIGKEMAYRAGDGIYFDIAKYKGRFEYPIFVDKSAVKDEGGLSAGIGNITLDSKKRNAGDFALWKSRDEGFAYESRLGRGRPGWHIECSAMACNIFPDGLDIHSGGIDLAFPHHENEVAQSQARLGKNWVNFFIHTGHLHIDGLKMSKSLKNFITIPEFIKEYTPRQVRMVFLINKWNMPMTYSKESMDYAVSLEKKLFTFISVLESQIDTGAFVINNVLFGEEDKRSFGLLEKVKVDIHNAFCDNIDTSEVVRVMLGFINVVNQSIEGISKGIKLAIYEYLTQILRTLGLSRERSTINVGDEEVLRILSSFRGDIRNVCKAKGAISDFYKVTDVLRDRLKESGYIIEDKGDESRIRKV